MWHVACKPRAKEQTLANPTLHNRQNSDFLIGNLDLQNDEGATDVVLGVPEPVARPRDAIEKEDLISIEDLISEELEKSTHLRPRQSAPAMVAAKPFAEDEKQMGHSQVFRSDSNPKGFGVDDEVDAEFESVARASTLARTVAPEVDRLTAFFRSNPENRAMIMEHLRVHKDALRAEQDILQSLISASIREGHFERVGKIDTAKRKIDEVFLQIRSLENTIQPQGVNLNRTEVYADGSTAESLFEAAQTDPGVSKKVERQVTRKQSWGISARKVKLVFLVLLLALMPLGYYMSAQWGLAKTVSIDHTLYASALPLKKAQGSGTTFTGLVDSSWSKMKKSDKETGIKILASLIRSQGYQTIFLVQEKGIAGTYNLTNDKFLVY